MKTKRNISLTILAAGAIYLLYSCASIPKKARVITNFDVNKYLGTWYEIARFDFKFEKNLNNVSAQYSLNPKGNIDVLNSGYNFVKNKWSKAEGIAKFRGDTDSAALKVSFFGPFYSGYNVIALDEEYKYALVAGKNLDYLWILSRTKTIPQAIRDSYLALAQEIGYDTSRLIWVTHDDEAENPYLHQD